MGIKITRKKKLKAWTEKKKKTYKSYIYMFWGDKKNEVDVVYIVVE